MVEGKLSHAFQDDLFHRFQVTAHGVHKKIPNSKSLLIFSTFGCAKNSEFSAMNFQCCRAIVAIHVHMHGQQTLEGHQHKNEMDFSFQHLERDRGTRKTQTYRHK